MFQKPVESSTVVRLAYLQHNRPDLLKQAWMCVPATTHNSHLFLFLLCLLYHLTSSQSGFGYKPRSGNRKPGNARLRKKERKDVDGEKEEGKGK